MSDSKGCKAVLSTCAALLFACALAAVPSARADEPVDLLVVAAHPDDEVLMSAGITLHALETGRTVRFVYVTNGDFEEPISEGFLREGETVQGASFLGMAEQNLVFLGYPDGYLQLLNQSYTGPEDQFVGPNGQGTTYGNRGLGGSDYHTYRFGEPALYNRANVVTDLEDLLATWKPRHILVTSEWDKHSDHATTYTLLQAALSAVLASDTAYRPTVHKTIVWSDSPGQPHLWPEPTDPTAYHVAPPSLPETPLVWAGRESIDVPFAMQSTILGDNPKHQAISAHGSQGGAAGFLGRFLHKDEFFWAESPAGTNHPPHVEAGAGQTVAENASVVLDASASSDPEGTSLTYAWAQTGGIPVTLGGSGSIAPSFTAPSGLTADEVLTFELTVSDGELTSIPDLVTVTVVASSPHIPPTNIAPLAAVTASSENAGDGQLAVKAVDGVVDGWPGDYTREWAAAGEANGAWIELSWSRPYSVSRVVLFDRPNGEDQILAATLLFSDGTTETIGALDNGGAGNEFVFEPRVVTSIRLTVTSTGGATQNVGLAEFQVFRTPSPDVDGDGWTVADGDCDDQSASVEPQAFDTTCNGIDENCSGVADEGYVASGSSCGVGACGASGVTSCVDGQVVDSCVAGTPGTEVCDGVDNDCNGAVDDGYVSQPTSCGVGACGASGATSCVGGQVVDTCVPGTPGTEVCDGVDNDCNGAVDDGYVSQPTSCGVGACGASGGTSCVGGHVVDSCVPGAPGAEACDGVDNDCNGAVDDAPVPTGIPSLTVGRSAVSWTSVPNATGYDAVRGSLRLLASSGGNFATATEECLGAGLTGTSLPYGTSPPAGEGWWLLVRPVSCGGDGSFNEAAPSQAGNRDPEIASSPATCP